MPLSVPIAELSPGELAVWLEGQPPAQVARLLRACGEVLSAAAERVAAPALSTAAARAREEEPIPPPQAARELGVARSTPHTWGVQLDGTGRAPRGVWRAAQLAAGGRGRKAAR